jgi:hypothetical protein
MGWVKMFDGSEGREFSWVMALVVVGVWCRSNEVDS